MSKYMVEKINDWWTYNSSFKNVRIDLIYNYKDINVRNANYVLLFDVDSNVKYVDVGARNIMGEYTVSLDIRAGSYDDYVKIRDNVFSFLKWFGQESNYWGWTDSGWTVYGFKVVRQRELSDKMRMMWRMVIDISLMIHYGHYRKAINIPLNIEDVNVFERVIFGGLNVVEEVSIVDNVEFGSIFLEDDIGMIEKMSLGSLVKGEDMSVGEIISIVNS